MERPDHSRLICFEAILGFRDLGGYRTKDGRRVAWRRLFRSGELRFMTGRDASKIKNDIRLAAVIDLRNAREGHEQQQEIALLNEIGAKYYHVPFNAATDRRKEREQYADFSHMGQVYLCRIRHEEYGERIVEALEIMARPENYPLVFHCVAGKDRSGVLAAFVLSVLGVADADIIRDYTLAGPFMKAFRERLNTDLNTPEDTLELPAYTWEATPESMEWFLSALRREYGSAKRYLEIHGAKASLFDRMERALLV